MAILLNLVKYKLECSALKWAVCEKNKFYLYQHMFLVLTNNNPLAYILTSAKQDATSHRWVAELSSYNISIKYRSVKNNTDADALSILHTKPAQGETYLNM